MPWSTLLVLTTVLFLAVHEQINNLFRVGRYLVRAVYNRVEG